MSSFSMRKSTILQSKENEICKKDRRQNLSFSIGTIPEGSGGIVPHIVPNIVPIIVPIELRKAEFLHRYRQRKRFQIDMPFRKWHKKNR